jgi:hypothetical protein
MGIAAGDGRAKTGLHSPELEGWVLTQPVGEVKANPLPPRNADCTISAVFDKLPTLSPLGRHDPLRQAGRRKPESEETWIVARRW